MLLPKKAAMAIVALLAFGSSCGDSQKKQDYNILATAGSSQIPLYEGPGFPDTCVGCLVWWAQEENPNKNDDPIFDWNALQRKCREKNQCAFFDYVNAWSSILVLERIYNGPTRRWADWRKAGKKAACFYVDSYFSGKEVCYESPITTRLPEGLAGEVSSFRLVNIDTIGVTLKDGSFRYLKGDGFNLIEDHLDSITEVSF